MSRIAVVLLAWGCVSAPAGAAGDPPNLVLILSDDQGWGDYGFMGHAAIKTPHIDRLAAESLVFTRGYVPTSLCRPSLATIATGLYPHQHKITGNDPGWGEKPRGPANDKMVEVFRRAPSLARLLKDRGYVSFQAGKWWEGPCHCGDFTEGMTHGDPARGARHGDEGLKIGRAGMQPVLEFIDRARGKPFLLWYAPMMPHLPHNPPERLLARYRAPGRPESLARYWAMCEWFDETVGELLGHLEKRGLSGNTIVAYAADNGWVQNEAIPEAKGAVGGARGKRTPYEGGIRTPILLRWPGKIAPRRDDTHLAGSIDLVPTILAACGVAAPAEMPGLNLLDSAQVAARDTLFGALFDHDVKDLERPAASVASRWAIEGRWKLVVPRAGEPELYDLSSDPHEKKNLAGEKPERAAGLRGKLDRWWNPGV